jgi:excinuclease ABC subunit C
VDNLLNQIKSLPSLSGVYKYFSADNRLLYVGKAKNLKSRVKSYWRFTPHLLPNSNLPIRTIKMLEETSRLEYSITKSEKDALILENSLIKKLNPKYNILLRDDKGYPYISIDNSLDFPRFEITREVKKGKDISYYGAFPNGGRVIFDAIYELFPLVQKKSCISGKKSCLFYEIGRCLAPCEGKVTPLEYGEVIERAKSALKSRAILVEMLEEKMLKLSMEERFEEAINIRDTIETIKKVDMQSKTIEEKIELRLFRTFDLNSVPYRVEVFDNSHLMGVSTVGGVVVWNRGRWERSSYRRYKLSAEDEYGQMREMLTRRVKKFNSEKRPDLWVIDGGDTLLQLALKILDEVKIELDVIAISKEKIDFRTKRAKGGARDIIYTKSSVFEFKVRDKRLQWVQRLRDEAHRFALSYHKMSREEESMRSSLLEKKGIGEVTVRRLLNYFGTFKAINSASFDEISVASSKKVAKILKTEIVKK